MINLLSSSCFTTTANNNTEKKSSANKKNTWKFDLIFIWQILPHSSIVTYCTNILENFFRTIRLSLLATLQKEYRSQQWDWHLQQI